MHARARRQRDDAARMIDDMIARSPHAYQIENTVVPKEDFDQLSPEMQQLVLLKQALAKTEREEKKAKERAAKLSLR
jgi:TRAP-type C4-dicarboxylate transport system substrate-binding protein